MCSHLNNYADGMPRLAPFYLLRHGFAWTRCATVKLPNAPLSCHQYSNRPSGGRQLLTPYDWPAALRTRYNSPWPRDAGQLLVQPCPCSLYPAAPCRRRLVQRRSCSTIRARPSSPRDARLPLHPRTWPSSPRVTWRLLHHRCTRTRDLRLLGSRVVCCTIASASLPSA